jgi:ketosteroid isomerase-like protein
MSEPENAAVVERVYDAFKRKDMPAILELQADDAEWTVAASSAEIPWAAPGRGHRGVKEFLRILGASLVAEKFEIREYLARGDWVVALGAQSGTVKLTGKPYAFDFVHVWKLRTGKVESFRVYYDTAYVAGVLRAT